MVSLNDLIGKIQNGEGLAKIAIPLLFFRDNYNSYYERMGYARSTYRMC